MADAIRAEDCVCCVCESQGRETQAVAFWPCIDPDVPSHPYCRPCLDAAKDRAMVAIFDAIDEGRRER